MKLAALIASAFVASATFPVASACPEFNLIAQPVEAEGYNPNSAAPVAMQIELILLDGPAERSCASHVIDITSQSSSGVRELASGGTVIEGIRPPSMSAFGSDTDTKIRLSRNAVNRLVATGRLIFDYAWIEPGAFYPAGLYTNVLDVEVNGHDVATLEPEITVFPAVRLLGDISGGYGQIDFGALESYEEVATNFIYQSNSPLTVTAQSQNNGTLVHEDGARVYAIPYAAFINNQAIATDGVQSLDLDNFRGSRNIGAVRLKLGDIGIPVAGEYADVLTLSFTAD